MAPLAARRASIWAGSGGRGSVAEGIKLGLHQVEPAQEIDELRPRELRADVAGRVGAGGAGGRLEAEAEEGDGVGGAGEVAAGHLDVRGPVDRLEQGRPAQRGAAYLAACCAGGGVNWPAPIRGELIFFGPPDKSRIIMGVLKWDYSG